MRGGWDALNAVPAIDGDDRGLYETARPEIKISDLLPLNDQFGLHPALAPLHELYQQGKMAVVHAVGLNYDTRSSLRRDGIHRAGHARVKKHNDQLYDHADLAITTDYRQVLSELLTRRLGNTDIGKVFPGYSPSGDLGIFRGI